MNNKIEELYNQINIMQDSIFERQYTLFTDLYKEYKKLYPQFKITRISEVIEKELKKRHIYIHRRNIFNSIKVGLHKKKLIKEMIDTFGLTKARMILVISTEKGVREFIHKTREKKIKDMICKELQIHVNEYKYKLPYKAYTGHSNIYSLRDKTRRFIRYIKTMEFKETDNMDEIEEALRKTSNVINTKLVEIENMKIKIPVLKRKSK